MLLTPPPSCQQLVEDPDFKDDAQVQGVPCDGNGLTSNAHNVANKWQRTDQEPGRIEHRHHLDQDVSHKNNTTNDDRDMEERDSRVVRPLPTQSLPFTVPVNPHSLGCTHPHQGYQSQVPLAGYNVDPPSYGYPSHPTNPLSVNMSFKGYGANTQALNLLPIDAQAVEWSRISEESMTVPASVNPSNRLPLVGSYTTAEHIVSNADCTENAMDFAYTTYAVDTTSGYNDNTGEVGLSSEVQQSTPTAAAAANSFYLNHEGYGTTPYYPTSGIAYLSISTSHHSNLPYPPHFGEPMPRAHSQGSLALSPQQYPNAPVIHHHHHPSYYLCSFPPPGVT
ncbi:hypothetical protein PM082_006164 [Marasmius tenuissimus]|nr:hypothetical protein PM082_006164 [Marasmius tenuissimus]